ncbi:MAG: hypothetical protein LBS81_00630 [Endomicrobium sp.]|jgi:thiamine-phosphate pyrophosphorylase|nr:hypothetical protein [Endomicrobium sp.]
MVLNKKAEVPKKLYNSLTSEALSRSQWHYFKQEENIKRILDANLNRCREGLRVVEDSLRFVLNDGVLYKKIRSVRHNVDKVFRNRYIELIKERNSFDDTGRQLPEISKKGLPDVVVANFKRTQESLRVLEEYAKTFEPAASACFKKERYATYIIEKSVYLKYKNFFK